MKINGLRNYRQEKKLSQSMIADQLNISRYQYIRMEQNETVPDKYIPLLSNILGYNFSLMTPYTSSYLQALRNIAGISQKEIATTFGVSQQSIMKLENGEYTFSYQKFKDSYFSFFKDELSKGDILPFVVNEVPGATILFCIDKCYILVNDEKQFNVEDLILDPALEKVIYKISK